MRDEPNYLFWCNSYKTCKNTMLKSFIPTLLDGWQKIRAVHTTGGGSDIIIGHDNSDDWVVQQHRQSNIWSWSQFS